MPRVTRAHDPIRYRYSDLTLPHVRLATSSPTPVDDPSVITNVFNGDDGNPVKVAVGQSVVVQSSVRP